MLINKCILYNYSMRYIESYRDQVFMELTNLNASFLEVGEEMKVCI